MAESKLTTALIAALEDPGSAEERIREVSRDAIETAGEAELIVRLLKLFPQPPNSASKRAVGSPLRDVFALMQKTKDEEAFALLRELGGPELLRIFDAMLRVAPPNARSRMNDDRLFLLKVLSIFAPEGGLDRLITAVRSPSLKNEYLWSVIFNTISKNRHPWRAAVIDALRDPLPDGSSGLAYLDLCNALARSGELAHHPFDSEVGRALLLAWLLDKENASYGHSAAASIPFLSLEARETVQALADQHPDRGVQLEAAWAAAACGEARGYQILKGEIGLRP